MTWPRSRRTGCARSQSPFGSSATAVVPRITSAQEPGGARGARPGGRCGRVRLARRPGRAGCTGRGARAADGADAARRLAGALRARRRRTAAVGRVAELPPVAERVQSPYDPEAHFSQKRQFGWTGYKVHVTEACDDDAAHLITHVMSRPAMRPDMASTAEIHEGLAAKGLPPSEHFVDSGYVDAGLLAGSRRGPRRFARRTRPGRLEPRGAWLRAAALHHRLGR